MTIARRPAPAALLLAVALAGHHLTAAPQAFRYDILIAGGEVTVVVNGDGKGGRCSDLALRYLLAGGKNAALFGSSDGADGNSGAAGIAIDGNASFDRHAIETELAKSNSFPLAAEIGRAIMIPPAGNNLRDLYLLARG